MDTELCTIMAEEGSDKSPIKNGWHNYTVKYHSLFNSHKNEIKTVFELGLGTNFTDVPSSMGPNGIPGASHRGWARYFKNANIYGADIDKRILFQEDRIQTYFVDQTKVETINELWKNKELDIQFDVMIDDGLHDLEANITFLTNSFHKLKNNGIYVIEDVAYTEIIKYKNILDSLQNTLNFNYEIEMLNYDKNKIDNCLILLKKRN